MADPPLEPDPQSDDHSSTPRWAKVLAIVIVALLLLFAIMHITGGGIRDHASLDRTSVGAPH